MRDYTKGTTQVIFSSIIYGFTPILVKISYSGGSNGITASFLRGLFSVLFLLFIMRIQRCDKTVHLRLLIKALIAGVLGNGATTVLLYLSYRYISVGTTTTIHFIYPALTAVFSAVLFKNKLPAKAIISLIISLLGVVLLTKGDHSYNVNGIVLALLSGFTYSFYIIYISKSELRKMPELTLALYINLSLTAEALLFGLATKQLSLHLTINAWLISAVVAVLASVVEQVLFQSGNKIIGAPYASIISVLEPVTSVVMSVMLLHESISFAAVLGCVFVVFGVVLISMSGKDAA